VSFSESPFRLLFFDSAFYLLLAFIGLISLISLAFPPGVRCPSGLSHFPKRKVGNNFPFVNYLLSPLCALNPWMFFFPARAPRSLVLPFLCSASSRAVDGPCSYTSRDCAKVPPHRHQRGPATVRTLSLGIARALDFFFDVPLCLGP